MNRTYAFSFLFLAPGTGARLEVVIGEGTHYTILWTTNLLRS